MKNLTFLYSKTCPYCIAAKQHMETLKKDNPLYNTINIKQIDQDEQPQEAMQYPHFYVPCFYIGDKNIAEGVLTLNDIRNVFDAYLEN